MVPDPKIFTAHPHRPYESWELAVTPLPLWLPVEGRRARAWIAICLNLDSDKILASEPGGEEEIPQILENLLTRAGKRWRTSPARLLVADAEVARILEGQLNPEEASIEIVARLTRLPEVVAALIAGIAPPDPRPGPLTGEGVTVERLRSFALAAARFYSSSCVRQLTNEDLIRIEAPEAGETLRYASISSQGSEGTGLWLFEDDDDFECLLEGEIEELLEEGYGFWILAFDQPWTAPPEDVEVWERHGLAWVDGTRCPNACFATAESIQRPDARQLAFLEGLLAALAVTEEADLDAGRWEKQVETVEGSVRFVLTLPGLLEPEDERELPPRISAERSMREITQLLEEQEFADIEEANRFLAHALAAGLPRREPETPSERAEDLLDRARRARGRRTLVLARQALGIWPDCADAYSLMASRAPDPEAALDLFTQAVAAAERALEPGIFEEEAGHFWGRIETRPYMRAREGLAQVLLVLGRLAEAAEHFQEMLRLNPNDNQGVRESLINVLIVLDRDEEAAEARRPIRGGRLRLNGLSPRPPPVPP